MVIHFADPEIEKIRKKIRWLRWKSDVLLRKAHLTEKLKKSSGAPHDHKPVG